MPAPKPFKSPNYPEYLIFDKTPEQRINQRWRVAQGRISTTVLHSALAVAVREFNAFVVSI